MLALLHTSPAHVPVFGALGERHHPGLPLRHAVAEELLTRALAEGPDAVERELDDALRRAVGEGAAAVLCTCSTIGGAAEARSALRKMPGVSVVDHRTEDGYVTPAEVAGEDSVFVSRIREDQTVENGLSLWIVADNIRKGAALNAVQIAELLARDYL